MRVSLGLMENHARELKQKTGKIITIKKLKKNETIGILFETAAGDVFYGGVAADFADIDTLKAGDIVYLEFYKHSNSRQADIEVVRKTDLTAFTAEAVAHNAQESLEEILSEGFDFGHGNFIGAVPDVFLRHIAKKHSPSELHMDIVLMERIRTGAGTTVNFHVPVISTVMVRSPSPWKEHVEEFASKANGWEVHETEAMKRSIIYALSVLIKNSPTAGDPEHAAAVAEYAKANRAYERCASWFSTLVRCTVDFTTVRPPRADPNDP